MLHEEIDEIARLTCSTLNEEWSTLSEERKRSMRIVAYRIYEVMRSALLSGMIEARDEIQSVLASNTIKARFSGLVLAHAVLSELCEDHEDVAYVDVPDFVFANMLDVDEHENIEAGDANPFANTSEALCNAEHSAGWICTRPQHPETWKHFDALNVDDDSVVLAVWRAGSSQLLSVLEESRDDDEA